MTQFCYLGARDSLCLEAGLCLHGHEMDENISPYEAKLIWTVRKSNKETGNNNESSAFIGRDALPQRQRMPSLYELDLSLNKQLLDLLVILNSRVKKQVLLQVALIHLILKKVWALLSLIMNEFAKDDTQLIQGDPKLISL